MYIIIHCRHQKQLLPQVTRHVTRSVMSSISIAAVTLGRALDVNTPPIHLHTATFTLVASRNDASEVAGLSFGADNVTSVTLPDNFHVDALDSVLISVGCINTCVEIAVHKNLQSLATASMMTVLSICSSWRAFNS